MGEAEVREVDHLMCGNCKFFGKRCKRVDHDKVKFALPWFSSYNYGQYHTICSDFEPSEVYVRLCENWNGFEDYWPLYVEQWLPYSDTSKLISFNINGDRSVNYRVPLMDFVYGRMYEDNKLRAVERQYYVRTHSGFGYKLMKVPVRGVEVSGFDGRQYNKKDLLLKNER